MKELKLILIYVLLNFLVVLSMLFMIDERKVISDGVFMKIVDISDFKKDNLSIVQIKIRSISSEDADCFLRSDIESLKNSLISRYQNSTIKEGIDNIYMNISGLEGKNNIALYYNCTLRGN